MTTLVKNPEYAAAPIELGLVDRNGVLHPYDILPARWLCREDAVADWERMRRGQPCRLRVPEFMEIEEPTFHYD